MRILSQLLPGLLLLFPPPSLAQSCYPIPYMPLGDSITAITCWRSHLWTQLQQSGYANVRFVGSSQEQPYLGCPVADYDRSHEGHSGFTAVGIAKLGLLKKWLASARPRVVGMHLGSNDISHGYSTRSILDAFTVLVAEMRKVEPEVKIVVAQIFPIFVVARFERQVLDLNARIPLWAAALSTRVSPIFVVDQHSNFTVSDTGDGLHPRGEGDEKMARRWYPAIVKAVDSIRATRSLVVSQVEL